MSLHVAIREGVVPILEKATQLELQLQDPALHRDANTLKTKGQEYALLQSLLPSARAVMATLEDLDALDELAQQDQEHNEHTLLEEERAPLLTKLADQWHTFQETQKRNSQEKETRVASLFLEIRAGTGGDEACLFCGDLFRMYHRYSQQQKWSFEVMSQSLSERGGYREIISRIRHKKAWRALQHEAGVHRVQRVPLTESGGRIHTSTATVAILPEPQETEDIPLPAKDLRIEVFRARGPGGQSVNTTDSAVRMTHIPSGIVVSQQDEKSQHRNKAKALAILRARLYERERQLHHQERSSQRVQQIGTGERCERIRTYNFPQGRITDHRMGVTSHQLEKVMNGEHFNVFLKSLEDHDTKPSS